MNTDTPRSKSPDQDAGDGEGDGGRMRQPKGMTVERGDFSASFNFNGDLTLIDAGGIQINQFRPGIHDCPLAGLWLRRHREGRIDSIQLTGSGSQASFDPVADSPVWEGRDLGVRWRVRLVPSAISPALSRALPSGGESGGSGRGASWTWEVSVTIDQGGSTADSERREWDDAALPDDLWDLVSAQDLALVEPAMAAGAESYISQYIAYHVQDVPNLGSVLSARQTMGCAPRLPLYVTGISQGCRAFMTDGYDFYGLGARLGGQPAALADADWDRGGIDQYEFAMACLLSPGVPLTQGGLTWQVWNMALSDYRGDLGKACVACAEASEESRGRAGKTEADDGPSTGSHDTSPASPVASQAQSATSLLISSALLNGDPLPEDEFGQLGGGPIRQPEADQTGHLLSYFGNDACHVVSTRKELEVARSHGQILLSGNPDTDPSQPTMAATTYAGGVFASQVVLGNTNMNQLISVQKTGLGL
ncbi:MAG: hypothetical protein M3Z49_07825, partial [Bifidobacteriales bacterium]|nr:hypothetical protein [Bifidobacteriales bacterium]